MALVRLNKNPSRKDLAWFGVLFAAFFGIVGYLAWRKPGTQQLGLVLWGAAVVVPAVYYAIPPLRRPIYLGWMYLAFPIGLAVSYAVLAFVYFVVVTPIGLVLRLTGRDPLQRAFERARTSYWIEHRTGEDSTRYFGQY
jgi:hypothetical protein